MSYNLVDPTTGDLTRVAGGIDTSIIPSDASASNKLVTQNGALIYYQSDSSSITNFDDAVPHTSKGAVQMFYLGSDITNAPTSSGGGFIVIAKQLSSTYISQLATQIGTNNTYTRSKSTGVWSAWADIITSNNIGNQTVAIANKIEPNYAKGVNYTTATPNEIKYIKVADCTWDQTGTLQVLLGGAAFEDTLVLNFGGGNAEVPMLCGHYSGHGERVLSVIAQKASNYSGNYSIYIKVNQLGNLTVKVALLKGDCTINITESTTAPTNISEWKVGYGFFGNITAPNITSLEQRVTALESKLQKGEN